MKVQQTPLSMPVHDYSSAIERAVSWLGQRYLLAAPVNPRPRRPGGPAYYLKSAAWLEARRGGGS